MVKRWMSRPLAAAFFALLIVTGGPAAADGEGAAAFVQRIADEITAMVADDGLPAEALEARLAEAFQARFDLATISRFTLGRYWETASAEERTEYRALFAGYLVRKYVRLTAYTYAGERLVVTGAQAVDAANTMVTSRIERPGAAPVQVVWQVRAVDGGYLALDSIVEGVSLVRALRDEFTSVVRNNGGEVATLIAMMRGVLDGTG